MPNTTPSASDLTARSRRILYAVLAEYIATGEPVGSRKLARRYGINLSPASVRNVLADLEEAGYLAQPHTSAGRVPTDAGFRLFVDALVQMREVTSQDRDAVLSRLRQLDPGRDDIIREAGRLLATMTGAAAVLTAPRLDEERLTQIRFLPLRPGHLLAVLVTRSGAVQNRAVPVAEELSASELERLNNYLNELVAGSTLREIRERVAREMDDERGEYHLLQQQTDALLDRAAQAGDEVPVQMVIEGQGVLFDRPEFADAEKIRGYLRTFEDKERLLVLLDRTLATGGVRVLIGAEAELEDLSDVSLVAAHYGHGGAAAGSLGIIGPTRMDYAKVVPLVEFTAQCLTDLYGEGRGDKNRA
ncbi:MAG: heat-inducible transcriptional repressor HrcA [Myxococcota bacterium]